MNYHKLYNGLEYKKLFWAASMSTTVASFEGAMEELKCINYEAYDHLMKRNPESWSRAYFADGRACEAVENGISESFNSVIMEARTKPLLTMLEEIRLYVMERFHRMADKHDTWREDICPAILKKLQEWCQDVRYLQCKFNSLSELVINFYIEIRLWTVVASETNVFEVRLGFDGYQVDLDQKFCTCRLWAVSGIPCIHACAAMNFTHHQPQDYISEWFTKKKFAETYIGNIRPLNGSNMWARAPYTKPLPPIVRRMPGRPKVKRRKHVTEVDKGGYRRIRASGGTKICTNCWQKGHNKRTCKNPTTSQPTQLRKKMGRPRTRYREESTTSQPTQPTQPTQTTRNPTPKETGKKKVYILILFLNMTFVLIP